LFCIILIGQTILASDFITPDDNVIRGPYEIHQFARDEAWTWFNDERAIVYEQVLYIGTTLLPLI